LLEALMQLFALLTDVKEKQMSGEARLKVEDYLSRQFNSEYVRKHLDRYDYYLNKFHKNTYSHDHQAREKQSSYNMTKLLTICDQLNSEMQMEAKILLLSLLLNFIQKEDEITDDEERFVDTLADNIKIDPNDYWNQKTFALDTPLEVVDKSKLLLISGQQEKPHPDIKHIFNRKQQVFIWVLHVKSTNSFLFKYSGERNLYLNGHKVEQHKVYPMEPGSVVKTSLMQPVYYGTIAEKFIARQDKGRILYKVMDIEYRFPDNQVGIYPFSFRGRSGQLVAIMGGSGTGKSTLLGAMSGTYKLKKGSITLNGYDLRADREQLQGVIGFVPQDDMLNEELTVYQNLMFNARFIFSDLPLDKQHKLVEQALNDFDLVEARDLVVGSPLNKILSGGQRKRLNIALELMREPSVLFVDEPTSGLSSIDSEKVMMLLKKQVLKGKLVIINIHQPNSDLYKLIDKLLIIDKGGRIIFNGNPMDAIVYFKTAAHYVNPEERECYVCGNVKTEQPLSIIEARMVNPYGKQIRKRKVSPEEWYKQYHDNIESKFDWKNKPEPEEKEKLPKSLYHIPSRWKQFKIYAQRDALKKLKDSQYVFINLIQAPILAFILGFFTKYSSGGSGDPAMYLFGLNTNIPVYLFMSVVVALFIGLNVSAEEIIKDRKLLQREKFLNLSRSSYLNSKIMNLMFISAIQSLSFVLIGNYILEIKGMWLGYWGILFSTFVFANMLGLNISSGLKSVVAIYIIIPLLLVPQLLFSGTMVAFDKLHPSITNREYVPRIGDIMASRWAYEALAVYQYADNDFEKNFFETDLHRSEASYIVSSWIPELRKLNNRCRNYLENNDQESLESSSKLLFDELNKLARNKKSKLPKLLQRLIKPHYNDSTYNFVEENLEIIRQKNMELFNIYNSKHDEINKKLTEKYGSAEKVVEEKKKYVNEALYDWTTNRNDLKQIEVYDDIMVRKKQPIYYIPQNNWGRAQFYAPAKNFAGLQIYTPVYNVIILWLSSGLLYFTLYFDVLRAIIRYFENFRLSRMNKRLQKVWT
jgi:ABC-type multidrug transport system ATPase subunit